MNCVVVACASAKLSVTVQLAVTGAVVTALPEKLAPQPLAPISM